MIAKAIMAFMVRLHGFVFVTEKSSSAFSYATKLSTVPYQKREEGKFPAYDKKGAALLNITESCGGDVRCHKTIVHDFKNSAHNVSYRAPYFQKNLQLLEREEGKKNTLICAGCHASNALFSMNTNYSHYKNNNASSCAFCHSISEISIVDKRTSSYTISLHKNHLSMFIPIEQKGLKKLLNFYFIKLNPDAHKKVFSRTLYKKDAFCLVCHHLNIVPPDNQDFVRATCVDCHMQPENVHGFPGSKKNHYFPGTNTAIPFVLRKTRNLLMMQKWIRGDIRMQLKTGNPAWELRANQKQVFKKSLWLVMTLETLKKPVAGEKLPVRIFTSNVGMEHDFPAAPLDLIDVWLEVKATDEKGKLIFHSGALNKNFYMEPRAHRLGGIMLDKNGKPITKNRVWAIDKKIVQRVIKPGETIHDDYEIFVPENARLLHISAQWNYRKLNQDFIRWAFEDKSVTMPVTKVGILQTRIKI